MVRVFRERCPVGDGDLAIAAGDRTARRQFSKNARDGLALHARHVGDLLVRDAERHASGAVASGYRKITIANRKALAEYTHPTAG